MAKYHTSIRTLPVWNFYEILKTGDLSHLYHDEKGEDDLTLIWRNIYDEYCTEAKVDNRHLKQIVKIHEIKHRFAAIERLLEFSSDPINEVAIAAKEALKSFNYIFRKDLSHQQELDRLKRQLSALRTKIQIEEKKLPKEDQKEAVSLMKQAVSLENLFPGRNIDIYVMSVQKWIALCELANETIRTRKKAS